MGFIATISVSAYTAVLTDLTAALAGALPTVAIAAVTIAGGLLVLHVGFRVIKRFVGG